MATREDVAAAMRQLADTLEGLVAETVAMNASLARMNRLFPDPAEEAAFIAAMKRRDEQPEV